MNRQEWISEFEGKRILIWGYGREGKSSYRLIRMLCPNLPLTITDSSFDQKNCRDQVQSSCTDTVCLPQNEVDYSSFDLILKSPGIVLREEQKTLPVSGQTQLFLKHYANRTVGITGTKGKSTTASLTAAVLSEKYHVHLVGNIGIPCFDAVPEFQPEDLAVFELSCHQLEYCPYSPHVAVFLNLYEEHLDHYGSMQAYAHAKENIFLHQSADDIAILNQDLHEQILKAKNPLLIGKEIRAEGKNLFYQDRRVSADHCRLLGEHNYRNLVVAYAIGCMYHVSDEQFLHAAESFEPLAHRLQDLGEISGIRFVDDSISTIGQSCIQALETLNETDTVLIGGMDRGIEYHELEDYLAERKDLHVIFMYASGKRIYDELREKKTHGNFVLCTDLAEAVQKAKELTRKHHICLLSPAASSYDHFKNFEERGDAFRKLAEK